MNIENAGIYTFCFNVSTFLKTKPPDDMTFHGLRHSCCAILFEKERNLGKVQNWLEHSNITVTANIYNHVSKKWRNKYGKMVDKLFG